VSEYEQKNVDAKKKGFCTAHPKELCIAFSEVTGDPICLECLLTLNDGARKNLVECRDSLLGVYTNNHNELKQSIESYAKWSTKLQNDKVQKKSDMKKYFENLRSILNKKEEELNVNLDTMHSENEKACQKDLAALKTLSTRMDNEINFVEQIKLNKISHEHISSLYDLQSVGKIVDGFNFTGNETLEKHIHDCANVEQMISTLTIMQRVKLSKKSRLEITSPSPLYMGQKVNGKFHFVDDAGNPLLCSVNALKIRITDKDSNEMPHDSTDTNFSFVPTSSGEITIDIMVNGSKMESSPVQLNVEESVLAVVKEFTYFTKSGDVKDFSAVSTINEPNNWIGVKVAKPMAVQKYTLRSPSLRSWTFEGSSDNVNWTTLKDHKHDYKCKDGVATWEMKVSEMYNLFRIRQTGKNAYGTHELVLSSLELSGLVAKQ
jgi:hypothetical protein